MIVSVCSGSSFCLISFWYWIGYRSRLTLSWKRCSQKGYFFYFLRARESHPKLPLNMMIRCVLAASSYTLPVEQLRCVSDGHIGVWRLSATGHEMRRQMISSLHSPSHRRDAVSHDGMNHDGLSESKSVFAVTLHAQIQHGQLAAFVQGQWIIYSTLRNYWPLCSFLLFLAP